MPRDDDVLGLCGDVGEATPVGVVESTVRATKSGKVCGDVGGLEGWGGVNVGKSAPGEGGCSLRVVTRRTPDRGQTLKRLD